VRLKDGGSTGYALGLSVGNVNGHRVLRHGGEVSGFTATNIVLPDDGVAVAALTNLDATNASGQIAQGILSLLIANEAPPAPGPDATVRKVLEDFSQGKIERSLFTDNANAYFTAQALKDFADSLSPLGNLESVNQNNSGNRGGMIQRSYTAKFQKKTLSISIFQMTDGRFEQFMLRAQE
jgi:hypothetical protein